MKSILTVTDFSASGDRAVARAALLAAALGAELTIAHAALHDAQAPPDAAERLTQTARSLASRHGLRVQSLHCGDRPWARIATLSSRADLLVIGQPRRRSCWTLLFGCELERLSYRSQCPLLVVKKGPLRAYRRLLVALDFSSRTPPLLRLAAAVAPGASIELFHALSTFGEARRRAAAARQEALASYRSELRREAQGRLLRLRESLDARRNRVMTTIGRGDPLEQLLVQQDYAEADLLLVGQRRRSWLQRCFDAPVAQRLLAHAGSDVLLVPQDHVPPSGTWARLRLRAERAGPA